jgi:S-adenosylmethionine-diacylglycerol 3-amino-3-carboxypropyl transferase
MVSTLALPTEIFSLPVNFSQVREDSLIDAKLLLNVKTPVTILMIGSGGDTVCHLATSKSVKKMDVVDASQAQINLIKIKLALLGFSNENRLAILGHREMTPEIRYEILKEIAQELKIDLNSLAPRDILANEGLDFCGRYEQLFKGIQRELKLLRITPEKLLHEPTHLKEIFAEYFSLPLLVQLFGAQATQNPRQSFSQQFAIDSYPWHKFSALTSKEISPIQFHREFMLAFLAKAKTGSYDFIHLSNILDWLNKNEAEALLEHTFRALSPGGKCLIRQLNSSLNIPQCGQKFSWNDSLSKELTEKDRSFFYRQILVGEKPC